MYVIQYCFICRPLDSTVSEDAETCSALALWLMQRSLKIVSWQQWLKRKERRRLGNAVKKINSYIPHIQLHAFGGFIKGILRGVRCTKSLRVLFLHRRPPSWTTLVLYSRAVFLFYEPASYLFYKKRFESESIATLPPFGPMEGQKWDDQISSQWESQKNRLAFISFGKSQFKPPTIWDQLFMTTVSEINSFCIWTRYTVQYLWCIINNY